MTTTEERAKTQAAAQYASIVEMVTRLEHAQECQDFEECELRDDLREVMESLDVSTLEEYHDEEKAREAIEEDALSVDVRSSWQSPGESLEPAEFQLLLCTGGPAARIVGELDETAEPRRAWMEYQDWGTPWTQYFGASQDTLLAYAGQFCFGVH